MSYSNTHISFRVQKKTIRIKYSEPFTCEYVFFYFSIELKAFMFYTSFSKCPYGVVDSHFFNKDFCCVQHSDWG